MNTSQVRLACWLAVALCLAAPGRLSHGQGPQRAAIVRAIRGPAVVIDEQHRKTALKVGQALWPPCRVESGAGAQVDLSAKRNGVVRLVAETTLVIEELSLAAKAIVEEQFTTRLNLKAGRVLCHLDGKMGAVSFFEIRFPGGTVSLRGTEMEVNADGVVRCYEGVFNVQYDPPDPSKPMSRNDRSGLSRQVSAGQTCSPPTFGRGAAVVSETPKAILEEAQRLFQSWRESGLF